MRRKIISLWFLLLTVSVWGQSRPATNTEKTVILRVRNLLASSFDRSLPNVTLDYFLNYEAEGAPIRWVRNDCGEPLRNPNLDLSRDFPLCVRADADLNNGGAVTVLVSVGTFKKGVFGAPALFSVAITQANGMVRPLRSLGELPMELHRPPSKVPKDLPLPVGEGD
jgi:hypothetical protein